LSSWKTASLFGNNVWITGCTWLPSLSTHSLAVRVIMMPTDYHDVAAQTITEPLPFFSVGTRQAFRIVGFLCCSQNLNSSWCREQSEERLIWPYHARVCSCLMPRFYGRNTIIYATEHYFQEWEVQQLMPYCGCWICEAHYRTVCVETGPLRWILIRSAVTYAVLTLWFLATIIVIVRRFFSVIVDFHPLFLLADVVFPWFVYAYITLETVSLNVPNIVAVFITDAPGNAHQLSVLFQNRTSLPFSDSFTRTVTQQNHWHKHYRVQINKRRKFNVANWSSLNVANTKNLFLNFLVFPLFCLFLSN
jgi:hypothetical protein